MIESFKHKGLRRFCENDDRKLLPQDMVERIRDILTAIEAAETIEALSRPGFRLHALKGELVSLRAFGRSRCARTGGSSSGSPTAKLQMLTLSITTREAASMMKSPSHPGRLIKADIDELGISVIDAAKALGISRQQLHAVISGRAGVTPEMAVRLEKALGSTADTWLRMQMNYDLAQVRKAGAINVKRLAPA